MQVIQVRAYILTFSVDYIKRSAKRSQEDCIYRCGQDADRQGTKEVEAEQYTMQCTTPVSSDWQDVGSISETPIYSRRWLVWVLERRERLGLSD